MHFLICKVHFHYKWQFNITLLCHAKYTAHWQSINWTKLRAQRKFSPYLTLLLPLFTMLVLSNSQVVSAATIYHQIAGRQS